MKEKRVRSTCVVMTTHGQLSTSSTSQMTTRERHTRCLQADNRWHIFPIDGEKRTAVLHAKKMADPFFVFHIRSRHLSGLNLSATQEAEKKFWKKKEINNKKKKHTRRETLNDECPLPVAAVCVIDWSLLAPLLTSHTALKHDQQRQASN